MSEQAEAYSGKWLARGGAEATPTWLLQSGLRFFPSLHSLQSQSPRQSLSLTVFASSLIVKQVFCSLARLYLAASSSPRLGLILTSFEATRPSSSPPLFNKLSFFAAYLSNDHHGSRYEPAGTPHSLRHRNRQSRRQRHWPRRCRLWHLLRLGPPGVFQQLWRFPQHQEVLRWRPAGALQGEAQ